MANETSADAVQPSFHDDAAASPPFPSQDAPSETVHRDADVAVPEPLSSALQMRTSDKQKAKRFELGVLFVHGFGTQPAGTTLVDWSDELLKIIGRATNKRVEATVERACPGDGSSKNPAEATVRIHAAGQSERWLLTEGWWAKTFPAPSYRELVSWSLRAVPWSIALHIAQGYWQTQTPEASSGRRILAGMVAVFKLVGALALAPLFIVLLVLTLLLGLLPIPQLRTVMLSSQSALTGTVGDSLAFVESPVRAALMRTRILQALERLIKLCTHTVIVAHSQGAAAVHDALGGIDLRRDRERTSDEQARPVPVPDALLTFGSGINQLVSLKILSRGLPPELSTNPAYSAAACLLAALVILAWFFVQVRAGNTQIGSVFHAATVWAVAGLATGGGICAILWWAAKSGSTKASDAKKGITRRKRTFVVALIVGLPLVVMFGVLFGYPDQDPTLPLVPVLILCWLLLSMAAFLILILWSGMKKTVTEPVGEPRGLARWVDVFASADPVPNGHIRVKSALPNGPTKIEEPSVLTSVRIWNRGSLFADHTTYWKNLDGFTLRVARLCAETAKSPWMDALPPQSYAADLRTSSPKPDAPKPCTADLRAAWRVNFLRLARWMTVLAWLSTLLVLLQRYGQSAPLLYVPTWLPSAISPFTRWAILVTAAAWGTYRLLLWPWLIWVRAEQAAVLAVSDPAEKQKALLEPLERVPLAALSWMGAVVIAVVSLPALVSLGLLVPMTFSDLRWLAAGLLEWDGIGKLLLVVALLFGLGTMLAQVALRMRPAPPLAISDKQREDNRGSKLRNGRI